MSVSSGVEGSKPDVIERGGYSEQGGGPEADTTVYAPDVTHGRVSPGPTDRRIDRAARAISRERFSRREPAPGPPPEVRPARKVPTMALLVGAFVALCVAGIALAVSLSRPAPPPPAPEVKEADRPTEIDGVPVRRGLRRPDDAAGAR